MERRSILKGSLALGVLSFTGYGTYWWRGLEAYPQELEKPHVEALVRSLADTIIPPTNTPGAIDCDLEKFIVPYFLEVTPLKTANQFVRGLEAVEAESQDRYGLPFTALSRPQREGILSLMEADGKLQNSLARKIQNKLLGMPFIVALKKVTCLGYAHSFPGATQALRYQQVPGEYVADEPFKPGQANYAMER